MEKYLYLLALTTISFLSFAPSDQIFTVDVNRSKIEWTGRKLTGEHSGELKLASGYLNFSNNKLQGGIFEIDMNSISLTDLRGSNATKLLGHLKSDDFFATDKNPVSKFIITKVKQENADKAVISGNLIIKGISNSLTFSANLKQKNNIVVAVANGVKVDRTKYNIRYGSKTFIDNIGNNAIDDNFELNIIIIAKK